MGNNLQLMAAHSSWYTQVDNIRKGVVTRKPNSENGHVNMPGCIPLGNITRSRKEWDKQRMKGRPRPKKLKEEAHWLARNGSPSLFPCFRPKSLRSHVKNRKRRGTRKKDFVSIMKLGQEKRGEGTVAYTLGRQSIAKSSREVIYMRIVSDNIKRVRTHQAPPRHC
jgi:hypothetical protein